MLLKGIHLNRRRRVCSSEILKQKKLLYKDLKLWFEIHYTYKTNIKSLYNTYSTVKYLNEQAWGREFHM